jgi:BirA family transcriptional regulator, biotin operon repressor / biotin---[acetyl-CoA-carboxylase] ligase
LIHHVENTGSTNADLIAQAASGAPEGTWLRANSQTGGRGRMGREWASPTGNLYASTLVRLRAGDPEPATLALVAAVALVDAVRVFAPDAPVMIKWPNDLMIAGRKLSGILLERTADAVVVGMGINLAHSPDLPDRPATSLAALGTSAEPAPFLEVLAEGFARWLGRWRNEGLDPIRRAWTAAAHPIGTALTVRLGDGDAVDGLFDGLAPDGALRLRLADGAIRAIHAGDVFLI